MLQSFYLTGGRTGMARRISWDEPSLTLTCSPAQKQTERCHPDETRPFTVREYARIQTFPDEWAFSGSINEQYKQIGNAVPVNLGKAIGKSVLDFLQKKDEIKIKKQPNLHHYAQSPMQVCVMHVPLAGLLPNWRRCLGWQNCLWREC